jgi:hypothetical protein
MQKEFESCRQLFATAEERNAFDQQITSILQTHGVDYARGYVAALKDIMPRASSNKSQD